MLTISEEGASLLAQVLDSLVDNALHNSMAISEVAAKAGVDYRFDLDEMVKYAGELRTKINAALRPGVDLDEEDHGPGIPVFGLEDE